MNQTSLDASGPSSDRPRPRTSNDDTSKNETGHAETGQTNATPTRTEVLIVGAGFAGLYLLYQFRNRGIQARAIDIAGDVGGTWYWNRYPGARCDIPSVDYSYSFDPELENAWTWSEKYATQPEILAYLRFVADRYDLRRDIEFDTRLESATWDERRHGWRVTTSHDGSTVETTVRHLVMATGCLSVPKQPEFEGAASFAGPTYTTGRWPHDPVNFGGKRVAVIGTGSSGIQSIPLIAEEADSVTVFQRTPNYSMPALNGPTYLPAAEEFARDRDAYREAARWSRIGVPAPVATENALDLDPDEREHRYEQIWQTGHLIAPSMYVAGLSLDQGANDTFAEFIRGKIRSIVHDPNVAEMLCPTDYPFGTKRPCLDTDYYETFNGDHVELVDVRTEPIERIESNGIRTAHRFFEVDALVYATGFDAMTGAIVAVDIVGRDHRRLADHWEDGPQTYLGLMSHGFPNLFFVTGPGSPSVLSNMAVSIEQHGDWIATAIDYLRRNDLTTMEPTELAESAWTTHVDDATAITLFPKANSWYMGANVPGKAVRMLPYVGGVGTYRKYCDQVVERNYLGFELTGPDETRCVDGVIAPLQVDVAAVLDAYEALGLPPLNSLAPAEARAFDLSVKKTQPAGPTVGEERSGTFPGATGTLNYQLFRPSSPGPHPVVVYYHGGGWVLGNEWTDAPFCRELCLASDALIVSVDYRHAPDDPFPAAVDDAWAALNWCAANASELGGDPSRLAVAGYSAGGNLAAVMTQMARDEAGPALAAQVLIVPVTDASTEWESYATNAEGYLLTADLMRWFLAQYASGADADDQRLSPLRGSLSGLPPAFLFAAEFDPLRDQTEAYGSALIAAGNQVEMVRGRGQIHTACHMVGVVYSAQPYREQAGWFLRTAFANGAT